MFHSLTPKPDAVSNDTMIINGRTTSRLRQTLPLLATMLSGTLLLSACQQQSTPTPEDNESQTSKQTAEQQRAKVNKPAVISDSAAARIEQFQPLYATQMQRLQRRLQAEYESLQAADASDSENTSLLNGEIDSAKKVTGETIDTTDTIDEPSAPAATAANINTVDTNDEINTSTEVGERDLEVLKRLSLEPQEPEILTEEQIIKRYQQAMQALYHPAATLLDAKETDTLLNIATLVPQLFEHAEIAERVNVKSPALARLIIQHQVWQQIEAQQAVDMQQMKVAQQQEFEALMTKFNDTIKDYDEQIAKYEQTLKAFQ